MKELTIGDIVLVKATVSFGYDDTTVCPYRKEETPFPAVITGIKLKQLGMIKKNHDGESYSFNPHSYYLDVTGTAKYWLVRRGMMNKELMVMDEDLELPYDQGIYTIPIKWAPSTNPNKINWDKLLSEQLCETNG